jgi:CheY-like chemotaxis protein
MPIIDGYEATKKVIQICKDHGIAPRDMPHIVALSGHVESEYQLKAFQSGMRQVYAKPISKDQLAFILLERNF